MPCLRALSLLILTCCFNSVSSQTCFDPEDCWSFAITADNHTIIIPLSANPTLNGVALPAGSYIGVFFDDAGTLKCAGYEQWNNTSTAVSVYGDDAGTPAKDGMANGETFQFKYLLPSGVIVDNVQATFEVPPGPFPSILTHTSAYAANGISQFASLSATIAPDNDNCATATTLLCDAVVSGTTIGASADATAGACGTTPTAPGVWYTFAGTGDDITLTTCGNTQFDTRLNVYSGDCANLVCVGGNDNNTGTCSSALTSEVSFTSVNGETYFILVSGTGGETGLFELSLYCHPQGAFCSSVEKVFADTLQIEPDSILISSGSGFVFDIDVLVNVSHTFISDVTVELTSPAGTKDTLFLEDCGGLNDLQAIFDDEGAAIDCPVFGLARVTPFEPLSVFDGESPDGYWSLTVIDGWPDDAGKFHRWCLLPTISECGIDANCNDNNVCTNDACISGSCSYLPQAGSCDDTNPCTDNDICSGGTCAGSLKNCNDNNPCTNDACAGGTCSNSNNTAACTDGNMCTLNDICSNGSCTSGALKDCNDGNLCTNDACVGGTCSNINNTIACEDGNPCTLNDACSNGSCASGTPKNCNDNNPCTDDACFGGSCFNTNNIAACEDGNLCTLNDICSNGTCLSGAVKDCNDGNLCTDDVCIGGTCSNINNTASCEDGNPCTLNDACASGSCASGAQKNCDDNNPCTDDACLGGACFNTNNISGCDDQDACTNNDICVDGTCAGVRKDCSDTDLCTQDVCFTGTCFNFPDDCDDADPCTQNICLGSGFCDYPPIACNDLDACTLDSCGASGCFFTPDDCDDTNNCTLDFCNNGCKHITTCCITDNDCDDNDLCTDDGCNSFTCEFRPVTCDDADLCTDDACLDGNCQNNPKCATDNNLCTLDCFDGNCLYTPICPTDNNLCTTDCINGSCVYSPVICNDNDVCNGLETCLPLSGCAAGTALNCNDNDACNGLETCNPLSGCAAGTPLNCDDNDVCTGIEFCNAIGGCVNDTPLNCDDNDVCTGIESCDPINACINGTPPGCDDNNVCTGTESCNSLSGCINGTPLNCNDNDICTGIESCNPLSGCVSGTPFICDDNNLCNGIESCDPLTGCISGTVFNCNDNNICTGIESCDPITGCVNGTPFNCDDNNVCNGIESCDPLAGCISGTLLNCNDNDICTGIESCDPITGCVNGTLFICDDNNLCNGTESCDPLSGCISGIPLSCNDHDVCTGTEACNPISGCVSGTPINCDDNDVCTGTESCEPISGCVNGTPLNCDDNDVCTGTESCNPSSGCANGNPLTCNDNDICDGVETCNPLNGCVDGTPLACDDRSFCTLDNCDAIGGCSYTDLDCDDSNECTIDECFPLSGCHYSFRDCNDLNACTVDNCDITQGCVSAPANCNDFNACTIDNCEPLNGCFFINVVCDDASACTYDLCNSASGCQYIPVDCNDFNACTDDSCSIVSACLYVPVDCDDQDACTIDGCDLVSGCNSFAFDCNDFDECTADGCDILTGCFNNDIDCNDNNACSFEYCDAQSGCQYTFVDCNDFTECTIDDCTPANGCSNIFINCDDHDACTDDDCDPLTGCAHANLNCNDNNECTLDYCDILIGCFYTDLGCNDSDACTDDDCDPASGCIYANVDCNDNDPCTIDACDIATGCSSTPINCADNDPCTIDKCVGGSCQNIPINCNDGDFCTTDACVGGECTFNQIDCNDINVCTDDGCNSVSGCNNIPKGCDDNNTCTDDLCDSATGCYTQPHDCDDGNACTNDSCDPLFSCQYAPHDCDDGNICTDDVCDPLVKCLNTPRSCEDGNACTDDACDPLFGCGSVQHVCDDGNICTDDACDPLTGCNYPLHDCNDGNACTDEGCDPLAGCQYISVNCDDGNLCTSDDCAPLLGCTHNIVPACNCIMSATISETALPTFCQGANVRLKAVSPTATSYLWSSGETTLMIIANIGTSYSVTVTNQNGCTATASYTSVATLDQLFSAYTIIADKDVDLKKNTVFSGGVGVSGLYNKLKVKDNSVITAPATFVKADILQIAGSAVSSQLSDPANVALPPFEYNPYCGSNEDNGLDNGTRVTVQSNSTVTLTGTHYEGIAIGKNCTVIFTEPIININNLNTKENTIIKFTSSCVRLRICNKLQLEDHNQFNPDSKDVIAFVEEDVTIDSGSVVITDIYMNGGKMTIKPASSANPTVMKGLFIAHILEAKDNVHWYQNTDCSEECYPEPVPATCLGTDRKVVSFTLVNATTDLDLGTLHDGDIINLYQTGPISVRADVCDESNIESVKFFLNGTPYVTENIPFYTIAGDNNGNYLSWNVQPGVYTIKAIPYSDNNATGIAGTSHEITITIIDEVPPCAQTDLTVLSFSLIDATNDVVLGTLGDGDVIDLDITGPISVRANICNKDNIESVKFLLNGNLNNIENASFYTIAGDNGGNYAPWNVLPGVYTIRAIPYSGDNATATEGTYNEVTITIIDNTPPCLDTDRKVLSLTLVNATTDMDIGTLTDGDVIDLDITGPINVRANVCNENNIQSVKFLLNGTSFVTENIPFYTIAGDNNSNYLPWNIQPGVYTIKAVPYSGDNATGTDGTPHQVTITIVGGVPPCNGERRVNSFTLVNANTDQDIGPMVNGAIIDLSATGPINVRANVCTLNNVGSVKFLLNGNPFRTESAAPFALAGDNSSGYNPWNVTPGTYTIRATPYSGTSGTGTAGTWLEITVTIISGTLKMDEPAESVIENGEISLKAYPNPFRDILNFEFMLSEPSDVKLEIFNVAGQHMATLFEGTVEASELKKIEYAPGILPEGVFIYHLQTVHGTYYDKAVMMR